MAMMCVHLRERAKAMVLPPAPAKMSIMVEEGEGGERSWAICWATGSGVTPNQAVSVRWMPGGVE